MVSREKPNNNKLLKWVRVTHINFLLNLLYAQIDRSWSFDDNHIDFYVYREKNYRSLNGEHKVSEVDIYEGGDCNLLNYS